MSVLFVLLCGGGDGDGDGGGGVICASSTILGLTNLASNTGWRSMSVPMCVYNAKTGLNGSAQEKNDGNNN